MALRRLCSQKYVTNKLMYEPECQPLCPCNKNDLSLRSEQIKELTFWDITLTFNLEPATFQIEADLYSMNP